MRGTELSKSNHEHTHTQTYYPLHTRKKPLALCAQCFTGEHILVLAWNGSGEELWMGDLPQRLSVGLQSTHTLASQKKTEHTCTQKTHNKNNKRAKEHTCEHYWLKKALFRTVYYLSKEKKKKTVYLTARGSSTDAQYWQRFYLLYSSLTGSSWCGYIGNSHKQTKPAGRGRDCSSMATGKHCSTHSLVSRHSTNNIKAALQSDCGKHNRLWEASYFRNVNWAAVEWWQRE